MRSFRLPPDSAALIDECGELKARLAEAKARLKPDADRAAVLEAQIASWYADQPPESTHVAEGRRHLVEIGPREYRRAITKIRKLASLLGQALFFEHASVPLKVVDELVPPAQHKLFLVRERTGPRELKFVAKAGNKVAA